MGQFDGLLPRLEYGTGSPQPTLDFTIPPIRPQIFPKAWTLEGWAPEADTGSTTEYEANHIYIFNFVEIPCQGIIDSQLNDFYDWWDEIRDGTQFTYYPDKDVGGTSYNVVKAMKFTPVRQNGLWVFTLMFRILAT